MANVLSEEKKQEVLALGRLGWPVRRIEAATGVRRETASKYLKAAGLAVRAPGRWGHGSKAAKGVSTDSAESKAAKELSTDSNVESGPTRPGRSPQASACEPHRDFIELSLSRGRNAMAIWQDLVTDHGFEAKYASVKRFVRGLRTQPTKVAHPVIVTEPGHEAQVDYGQGPMVRHPETGKYKRTRLFVLTLGFSRKCVRLLSFKSSAQIWAELHEEAFRRLGGVPRLIVLDNLREGVIRPDFYDPTLNPLYKDVLAHYGATALACRVRDPNRKGKVESGIGHAQKTPLKGLRFEKLEEAQTHLDQWEERWADTRIHGTTKRQVAQMFAEEKPSLLPLPVEPFRYYRFGDRTVHLDNCVEVDGAYYGAPPGTIGALVHVQWDRRQVRILSKKTGELLREHKKQKKGLHRIKDQDRSPRTPPSVHRLLTRASQAGENIGAVCKAIHERDGHEESVRRMQGMLSLAKKYGAKTVDDACAEALEMGVPNYRFLRRYLERKPKTPLSLRQVDPLIRELTTYRDLITQRTKEGEPT